MSHGVLDDVKDINVMITHTHSDHIGSLGSLVMYSYYVLRKPLTIVVDGAYQQEVIIDILGGFGCTQTMVSYRYISEWKNNFESFLKVLFIRTDHCDELRCFGLLFYTEERTSLLFWRY